MAWIIRFVALVTFVNQMFTPAYTQKIDFLGRKFVFALPTPYKPSTVSGTYRPAFYIVISTPSVQPVAGTITCPGVVYRHPFTTSVSQPGNVTIPATDYLGYSFTLTPRTITVEANGDVSVHASYVYSNYASEWLMGSTNVMPVDALGQKYFVASYAPYSTRKSEFTVTALDDESDTIVEITATNGERYREVLAPSDTYQLQSSDDLTGSLISADKPVSVMSGSSCSKVPITMDRCNYLAVHLTDVKSAGQQFILSPFKDRTNGYIFRVIGTEDNTQIRFSPGNQTVELHSGQFHETEVFDDTVLYLSSSAPVLVFKFGKGGNSPNSDGDPIMVVVPAVRHFVGEVTFPVSFLPTRRTSKYSISITIGCQFVDGLILDGSPLGSSRDVLTSPTSFCIVRVPITVGIHAVSHVSALAVLAVVIHAIAYKIGYAYQAGYNVQTQLLPTAHIDDGIPQYLGDDGLTLLCKENQMVVFMNTSLLTDGEASDVHFTDPLCFGQMAQMNNESTSVIHIAAGFLSCGTVIEESDRISIFKNHLIYRGPRNPGPVMRDPTFDIPVTCKRNSRVLVSLALAPKSKSVNKTLDGEELFLNVTYAFQMFRDKQYNSVYSEDNFPITVELGQSLYFEVSVSGAPSLKVMPQQCLATKSNDSFGIPNYIFVDNGCPSDNTVTFYQNDDKTRQRFSLQTFGFLQNEDGGLSNEAYVHCWLLACNVSDTSSRCNSDCSASDRSQRDIVKQTNKDLETSGHVYMSQGPIIFRQQDLKGDSSSVRSGTVSAVGGTLAVCGLILIVLLVFILIKIKQKRGSFTLRKTRNADDTVQLIEMTSNIDFESSDS